jgi:hypothetical protein
MTFESSGVLIMTNPSCFSSFAVSLWQIQFCLSVKQAGDTDAGAEKENMTTFRRLSGGLDGRWVTYTSEYLLS